MKKSPKTSSAPATSTDVYAQRGVSSGKEDVHRATRNLDQGLVPTAFCKILPDFLGGSAKHCNIIHADTAGTKAGLAWLMAQAHADPKIAGSIAVDALTMNVDDVGCCGVVDDILVNQTIGRNAFQVNSDMIEAIIGSADHFCTMLTNLGIGCHFGGGETASVGDIVRTLDVGSSVVARLKQKDIIDAGNMVPDDILVGFSSTGQAFWETKLNSGIGSNGLTNGRHDALCDIYRNMTETYAPEMEKGLVYRGPYKLTDRLPEDINFTIGEALLSPTRTYLPLIKTVLTHIPRRFIHGIIHCSGGGQTKIMKFGKPGNVYMKDDIFPTPPVFAMLQRVSGATWEQMYKVYNMGWRLEMAVPSRTLANEIIDIAAKSCGIKAQVIGRIEKGDHGNKCQVVIRSCKGELKY